MICRRMYGTVPEVMVQDGEWFDPMKASRRDVLSRENMVRDTNEEKKHLASSKCSIARCLQEKQLSNIECVKVADTQKYFFCGKKKGHFRALNRVFLVWLKNILMRC